MARGSALPDPASIHHSALNWNVDDVVGIFLEHVPSQHLEVGHFARLNRPLKVFFERSVSPIDGSHANRFFERNFLLRSPDIAVGIGARYFRLQRHHRLKRSRWIIRRLSWPDSGIDETAQREHMIHTIRSVLLHLLAVIVRVSRKRSGNRAQRL